LRRPELILASASASRAAILAQAGVACTKEAADVDEGEVKRSLRADHATADVVARALAELKALHVSRRHPDAFVIGADQMLDCQGDWFDKPADMDQARANLRALRGRRHHLVTTAVVLRDGETLWSHTERAALSMRPFSDDFLESYLVEVGTRILSSVGGYQLEGPGAQLFDRIEGDFFTILGLPLLPLLAFLRNEGILLE